MKGLGIAVGAAIIALLVLIATIAAVFGGLASAETLLSCGLDPPTITDPDAEADGDPPEPEATGRAVTERLSLDPTQEANARLIIGAGNERLATAGQLAAMLARSVARSELRSQLETGGLLGLDSLAFPSIDVTDKLESIDAYLAAPTPPFDDLDAEWLPEAEAILARWGSSTTNPTTCTGPGGDVVDQDDVTSVQGIQIHTSIAANLSALLRAAEADGIRLAGWGWRSHQRQHELRRTNGCTRNGGDDGSWTHQDGEDPSRWVASSSCRTPTARPGFSNHESGLAVDFTYRGRTIGSRGSPAFRWLATNAARYGFYNLPSEPWHWSVDGR